MAEFIDLVQSSAYGFKLQCAPKILLLPPCIPLPFVESLTDENGICFFSEAVAKITRLVILYEKLAKEKNCFYLDVSDIKPSNLDGVHYDQSAHDKYAIMVSEKIKVLFDQKI